MISVALVDMDIYSAEYVKEKDYKPPSDTSSDLIFSSFVVVRQVSVFLTLNNCTQIVQRNEIMFLLLTLHKNQMPYYHYKAHDVKTKF